MRDVSDFVTFGKSEIKKVYVQVAIWVLQEKSVQGRPGPEPQALGTEKKKNRIIIRKKCTIQKKYKGKYKRNVKYRKANKNKESPYNVDIQFASSLP